MSDPRSTAASPPEAADAGPGASGPEGPLGGLEVPPPLLGTWKNLYWLTVASLGLWMLLGWALTRIYGSGGPP